jgi:multidrug resistance efflux pump
MDIMDAPQAPADWMAAIATDGFAPQQPDDVMPAAGEPAPGDPGQPGYPRGKHAGRYRIGRRRSWPQRAGGVLIACSCVAAAAWYVPRVVADDRGMLTGTVTSSGVVMLNFPGAGILNTVKVHLGQQVHRGQVLATEYAPNVAALVAADRAAIAAVQAKITELKSAATQDPTAADNTQLATDNAQLAEDNARLATDRMRMTATEIVAPSDGVVVAANGQPGEDVTASGIRDYTNASGQVAAQQQPQFSLLPEGPQPVRHTAAGGSSLPVIALRISSEWQVVALIPEGSVQSIKPGQPVTISVPAARISDVRGQFEEVLPNPQTSSGSTLYQAVIAITGTVAEPPFDGMAADVRLLP